MALFTWASPKILSPGAARTIRVRERTGPLGVCPSRSFGQKPTFARLGAKAGESTETLGSCEKGSFGWGFPSAPLRTRIKRLPFGCTQDKRKALAFRLRSGRAESTRDSKVSISETLSRARRGATLSEEALCRAQSRGRVWTFDRAAAQFLSLSSFSWQGHCATGLAGLPPP